MIMITPYDEYIEDIDIVFKRTNNNIGEFVSNHGEGISFDFTDKNNKRLYTHYFLYNICEQIKIIEHKLIYYNNTVSKDPFRNALISKTRRIFGLKIFDGVWDFRKFVDLLSYQYIGVVDRFELFVDCDCKPKNMKHIKKYLEKEGLSQLGDTYFKDIANKMLIMC